MRFFGCATRLCNKHFSKKDFTETSVIADVLAGSSVAEPRVTGAAMAEGPPAAAKALPHSLAKILKRDPGARAAADRPVTGRIRRDALSTVP